MFNMDHIEHGPSKLSLEESPFEKAQVVELKVQGSTFTPPTTASHVPMFKIPSCRKASLKKWEMDHKVAPKSHNVATSQPRPNVRHRLPGPQHHSHDPET